MKKRFVLKCVSLAALGAAAFAAQAGAIRVTVPIYSDATKPYFEAKAKEFEAANPGSTVKIEMVNWDNMQQKLQTDIAGNSNADIAIIGTRWLLDFVKDDVAEPLEGHMNGAFKGRFIGNFLAPGQIKGTTYGLPIAASARAMYYNKDMLSKAGFPNGPQTWDDVIAASQKIKAAGGYGFGMQGKEIETDVYFYYGLWSYGGEVVGSDGKSGVSSAAGVKAATLYKSMIDQGLTQPGVTGYSREDLQNLFKQGRIGMMITAPFLVKQISKEAPTLQYGITNVPKGSTTATYAVTDSIMMFKNSKDKATAWKFLDYLFTAKPRVEFTSGEGFLPTTKDEAKDPAFNDPNIQAFIKLLPNAKYAPTITGWEDAAKAVSNAMQAIYLGKEAPAKALAGAATEANKYLNK